RIWDTLTGLPLSEPLVHEAPIYFAEFGHDGDCVLAISSLINAVCIWEVPSVTGPAPVWLAELAEAIAGQRINADGISEVAPVEELLRLKEQISQRAETDYFTRWAKWFFADRDTRTISPSSPVSVPEYVRRRIEENSLESLREAVRLA